VTNRQIGIDDWHGHGARLCEKEVGLDHDKLARILPQFDAAVRESKMRQMVKDAEDRATRGIEDANPADNEPIIDRFDLSQGYVRGNVQVFSGKVYKLRHQDRYTLDQIQAMAQDFQRVRRDLADLGFRIMHRRNGQFWVMHDQPMTVAQMKDFINTRRKA
jgi:hypothetical protein